MKLKIFQNNSLIEFLQGHKIKNASGTLTQRESLKFTGDVTVTDDSSNDQTIVNITGGGSGGHTILNGSGSAMNQRGKLQFVGADVTDDGTNDKTIVTTTPQSMIGDAWVTSHAYAVGDYAIDANGLYKNGTAHTSTATNRPSVNQSGYWTKESVASQLGGSGEKLRTTRCVSLIDPSLTYISNNTAVNIEALSGDTLVLERTGSGGSKYPFVVNPKQITVSGTTYVIMERMMHSRANDGGGSNQLGGYIGFDTTLSNIYNWAHSDWYTPGVQSDRTKLAVPAGTYYFYNVVYDGNTNDGGYPYTAVFKDWYILSTNAITIN